jgi:hypothetical protein
LARKQAQRDLEELTATGLVQRYKAGRVKTTGARLTAEGERRARALCALPGLSAAGELLADVARRSKGPPDHPPRELLDAWICELLLAGMDNYPSPWTTAAADALKDVEFRALPMLVSGLLVSHSDTFGRTYYAVTLAGWKAIDDPPPIPDDPEDIEPEHDLCQLYADTMRAALARLGVAAPRDTREIGPIPLPASPGGLPYPMAWFAG